MWVLGQFCIVYSGFFGFPLGSCARHLHCISLVSSALFPVSSPANQLPAHPCVLPPVPCCFMSRFVFKFWFLVQCCWMFCFVCSVLITSVQFYFPCQNEDVIHQHAVSWVWLCLPNSSYYLSQKTQKNGWKSNWSNVKVLSHTASHNHPGVQVGHRFIHPVQAKQKDLKPLETKCQSKSISIYYGLDITTACWHWRYSS